MTELARVKGAALARRQLHHPFYERVVPVILGEPVTLDAGTGAVLPGWTETVKFRNPTNDKIQTRVNYVQKVGDYVVGSGVFKD